MIDLASPGPMKTAPLPGISCNSDITPDMLLTNQPGQKMTSLSACMVEALKAEPNRIFSVQDLVEVTGKKRSTVLKAASRLSDYGKGSGPIMRVSHGFYKYDPVKEDNGLLALTRSGQWKIENLMFVSFGVHGVSQSLSNDLQNFLEQNEWAMPSGASPKPGYPKLLPTGQRLAWVIFKNGTQVIWFAANRAPPYSPDSVLNILHFLKEDGFNESVWECKRFELNVDDRTCKIEASYSLELMKGALLKAYQHGYNTRVEFAGRNVGAREVLELFKAICGNVDAAEALRRVADLERRHQQTDLTARQAYKVATRIRNNDGVPLGSKKAKTGARFPEFLTAAELRNLEREGIDPWSELKVDPSTIPQREQYRR